MDIETKILDLLKKEREGITISEIADKLGVHRHTITKYIYRLEGREIIKIRKIGIAKLCYLNNKSSAKKGTSSSMAFVLISIAILLAMVWYMNLTGYFLYEEIITPINISGNFSLSDIKKADGKFAEIYFENSTSFISDFLVKNGTYNLVLEANANSLLQLKILCNNTEIYNSQLTGKIEVPVNLTDGMHRFTFTFTDLFNRTEVNETDNSDGKDSGAGKITGFFAHEISSDSKEEVESGTPETEQKEAEAETDEEQESEEPEQIVGEDEEGEILEEQDNLEDVNETEESSNEPLEEIDETEEYIETNTEEESLNETESSKDNQTEDDLNNGDNQSINETNKEGFFDDANETNQSDILDKNQTGETEETNLTIPTNETNLTIPLNKTNITQPTNETNLTKLVNQTNLTIPTNETNLTILKIDFIGLIPIIEEEIPVNETNLTAPETITINYSKLKHKKIIMKPLEKALAKQINWLISQPVEWEQKAEIFNPINQTETLYFLLPIPEDAFNISVYKNNTLISTNKTINITIETNQTAELLIKFYTSPVEIEIIELDLEVNLFDLLPPEAQAINIYEGKRKIASYRNLLEATLKLPTSEKQIFVYHNSSLHYYNISVELPLEGNYTLPENFISTYKNNTLKFTIPKLSGVNLTLKPKIIKKQLKAEIGKPVKWNLKIGNTLIEYKTPAPEKIELPINTGKRIIISSNSSVHYYNITAFSDLPELDYKPKLYRIVNETRIEVTDNPIYNVNYSDTNNNSLYDEIRWIVPKLSNDTYEIELIILNVQSYPTVGGNWTVKFNTTGTANLTITAVNGTTWTNYSESDYDLKFLEIKCGNQTLDYEWINESVFVENYTCNQTGYEISKVLTTGKHQLRFTFGTIIKYAYNEVYNNTPTTITLTESLPDGIYEWWINCTANSTSNISEVRIITIDTTKPLINFTDPTTQTGNYSQNYIEANVTASDDNLANVTIYLYNSTSLLYNFTNSTGFFYNFTNLDDGTYYLNATVNDKAGNTNKTETRTILLDTKAPIMNYESPTPGNNTWISGIETINVSASDTPSGIDTILIFVDGSEVKSCNSSPCEYIWNTTTYSSGSNHTFNATANDTLGNTNYLPVRTVTVDSEKPITTISPNGTDWTAYITFTLNCYDETSNCNKSQYKIINSTETCNETNLIDGTSGTVTCGDGEVCLKKVCFRSIDNNNNIEEIKTSAVFKIDRTTYNNTPTTITLTESLPDGIYEWWINCTANSTSNISEVRTLKIDSNAPNTTATAVDDTGSNYNFNTWTNSTYVNVTLNCTGNCSTITYCTDTDNTCTPNLTYSTPVQISTEGISYIRYRSNDTQGYLEEIKSQTIKIDTTLPTPNPATINSISALSNTSIKINATEASDSGVGGVQYYFNETTGNGNDSGWQSSNIYTDSGLSVNTQYCYNVQYRDAVNNTGNKSEDSCKYTLANIPTNLQATEINPTQIVLEWNANGNPAGTYYNLYRGTSSIYESTSTTYTDSGLSCNAQYTYKVRAKNGDNVYTNFTSNLTAWTKPEDPILNSTTHTSGQWSSNNLINVTATTPTAGCADHYHYKWNTNPLDTVTGTDTQWNGSEMQLNATSDGNWYLHAIAHNPNHDANPDGTQHLGPFKIDTTPPTTTASAVDDTGASYTFGTWTSSTYVNVTLSCSDSGSGCDTILYCTDTDNTCTPNLTYSTPVQISTEGISYIRYRSNDTAGNLETTKTQTIKIDTIPPTVTIQSPENITYGVTSVDLNYTVSDSSSGVDSCWYSLDGGNNTTLENCTNTTLWNLTEGYHLVIVYANDSVGNIGESSANFTVSTLDLYLTKTFNPDLLVAYEIEQVNTTTKLKINHSYTDVLSFNLTDEIPWDFSLNNNSITVKLKKYSPYSETDVTNNVTVTINDLPGENNTKIEINCSNTSSCFGNYLQENDTIILNYLMNSSELGAKENRTTYTFGNITDINSKSKNRTINTTISVAEVVLRGYKDLWVDLSNPQNITARIVVKAIGGTLGNITLVDYLPEGATIYNRKVYWFNGSYNELTEGDDFNITIKNVTLPGGYAGTSYQYNFTATGVTWLGYLQDNESLIINYTFIVFGGGHWDLPAIISGYDPTYKKNIKTEMYADANVPSFDVTIEILTKKVLQGEIVKTLLRIVNVGGPRAKVDVFSNYAIKDLEGEIITEKSETMAVVEQKEKLLELEIPEKTKPGKYVFECYVTYTGREALSTETFEVIGKQVPSFWQQYGIYFAILILVVLNLIVLFKKR